MSRFKYILLINLLAILCLPQLMNAQIMVREILRGQIVSAEVEVDNVEIFNKSSNKGAITDKDGLYTIYAMVSDTLVIQSVQIKPLEIVLIEDDFKLNVFKIRLNLFVNELEEVVVTPTSLTGDLLKDIKNTKVYVLRENFEQNKIINLEFVDDGATSPTNKAMPSNQTIPLGVDLVKVGKLFKEAVFGKKKNVKKIDYNKVRTEIIKEKFTYSFFTETLDLKMEDFEKFLLHCETDPEFKKLIAYNKEFELIEFLVEKRKTFAP